MTEHKNADRIEPHIERKYQIITKIGKGAYGVVWRAIDRKTKKGVAIKKVFDAFRNNSDSQRTYREVMFLQRFNHENIIKLLDIHRAENRMDLYLVFEVMETDLHATIRANILENVHKQYIIYQLLRSIRYLHNVQVIHRDLKPANILINSDCHIKLADFGLARSIAPSHDFSSGKESATPLLTDYIATRWYRPPEVVLMSQKYTKAVDMWAVGCILAEMLLGQPLLPGTSTINQLQLIISICGYPSPEDLRSMKCRHANSLFSNIEMIPNMRLENIFSEKSHDALDLISKLLIFNPKKRLTVEAAMIHPYIRSFCSDEELKITKPLKPIILPQTDNKCLSTNDYRELIYKDILQKRKDFQKQKIISNYYLSTNIRNQYNSNKKVSSSFNYNKNINSTCH